MSRLFYASGDPSLAKRTLHLYVQVVSRALEAGNLSSDSASTEGGDDVRWVETLVEGARMLCRIASTKAGLDGRQEAREADALIQKAKQRMEQGRAGVGTDKEMEARLLLAEGIWNSTMAIKGKLVIPFSAFIFYLIKLYIQNKIPELARPFSHNPSSSSPVLFPYTQHLQGTITSHVR
jgi:hypothetical protein